MVRQYINGKLDAEFNPTPAICGDLHLYPSVRCHAGKINNIQAVFRIGKAQTGLPGIIGLVDEVAIYNRALTVDEINQDMEKGVYFKVENAEITKSTQLKGDVNGDGIVNIQDLVFVAGKLGQTGKNSADVNDDGLVNIQDLVIVASDF